MIRSLKIIIFSLILAVIVGGVVLFWSGGQDDGSISVESGEDGLDFAFTGDPHYGWTHQHWADDAVHTWMNDENFPNIEFGVNIGDFVHFGSRKGYEMGMKDSYNHMFLPWMFVFGNHDTADYKTGTGRKIFPSPDNFPHIQKKDKLGLRNSVLKPLKSKASTDLYDKPYDAIKVGKAETGVMQRNYAFKWDNVLFLVICDKGSTMLLTEGQRQWLNYMTEQYPDTTTITMSHQSLPGETYNYYYRYFNDIKWWESFIENNSQLVLHINGHNHKFKHYKYHGLDAVDVGISNSSNDESVYFKIVENKIQVSVWSESNNSWSNPSLFEKKFDTGITNEGLEWYSVSKRIQDDQDFSQNNKILAENYELQLIGSGPGLVGLNNEMEYWGASKISRDWIGYEEGLEITKVDNPWINKPNLTFPTELGKKMIDFLSDKKPSEKGHNFVKFDGVRTFSTSTVPGGMYQGWLGLDWYSKWVDGKVPDSTTPRAISGESYKLRVRMKADSNVENAMDISVKVLGENLEKVVMKKTKIFDGLDLSDSYQWYESEFTVPENEKAWIIKTIWGSRKSGKDCYLDEWSMTRTGATSSSENFTVTLNGKVFSSPESLSLNESQNYSLNPELVKNELEFSPEIGGSKTGIVRMVYKDPVLWSDDASFGVNKVGENGYNCRLEMVSNYSETVSFSPFKSGLVFGKGQKVSVKDYYTAWKMDRDELPENVKIRIEEGF